MRGSRAVAIGVAGLAGAIALCLLMPTAGPNCSNGPEPMSALAGCAGASAWLPRHLMTFLLVSTLMIALGVAASIIHQAIVHGRLSCALRLQARPASLAGQGVELVPGAAVAFVAGLRRPRIYCSDDLALMLDADELRAVLLHERHHQLTHAPARLVVLSGLARIVGRVERGRAWLERWRAQIEIAADAHAIRSGALRSALARALLKLDASSPTASLAAFSSANELRFRVLLGETLPSAESMPSTLRSAVLTAAAVAGVCLILSIA